MPEIEVDTDALRSDADDYWQPWSGRVLALEQATRAACGSISARDWSTIPGAQEVRTKFDEFLCEVCDFLHTGSEVMEGVAKTLLEVSAEYVEAEEGNVADLVEICAELEALQ